MVESAVVQKDPGATCEMVGSCRDGETLAAPALRMSGVEEALGNLLHGAMVSASAAGSSAVTFVDVIHTRPEHRGIPWENAAGFALGRMIQWTSVDFLIPLDCTVLIERLVSVKERLVHDSEFGPGLIYFEGWLEVKPLAIDVWRT